MKHMRRSAMCSTSSWHGITCYHEIIFAGRRDTWFMNHSGGGGRWAQALDDRAAASEPLGAAEGGQQGGASPLHADIISEVRRW